MQYLLTEQEFENLNIRTNKVESENKEQLQRLCTLVADPMLITLPWDKDGKKIPWTCILTNAHQEYCDCCPVSTDCPSPYKNWSK